MNIDENVVESIVKRVVSQLSTETASAQTCPSGGDWGVFESMNDAVDAAVEAQREYLNRSMHDRACYVQAIRDVVLDQENLEYILPSLEHGLRIAAGLDGECARH